ncbi:class I SAM-dependent methyltransferase [bacterium]|nr:class I SAM-dependent methyltransferase [bacterium]
MEWYKRWFGEEYLLVYEHRDIREAEQEIALIRKILDLGENDLILDLCCGPGRHDVPLVLSGCRVIGLDYSMPLLRIAVDGRPPDSEYPLYVCADARNIPFRGESFDVVLNLFTSFGYFADEENAEFIRSMERILKPGGRYLIDYLNPPQVISGLVGESVREKEGMRITEKRRIDKASRRIEKTIVLCCDEHTQEFRESVRLYDPDELLGLLRDAGLTILGILGSVNGEPYCETSPRMIIHGLKQRGFQ